MDTLGAAGAKTVGGRMLIAIAGYSIRLSPGRTV
jgi:hypothetical protein